MVHQQLGCFPPTKKHSELSGNIECCCVVLKREIFKIENCAHQHNVAPPQQAKMEGAMGQAAF
jgi:hypothetical protein